MQGPATKLRYPQLPPQSVAVPSPQPVAQIVPAATAAPNINPLPATLPRKSNALLWISLLVAVILPLLLSASYLWGIADDQYASTVGFSVRKEEVNTPFELLGGITELSGSSSSDTDILYEYLRSQRLVEDIDRAIDLRAIWSRPDFDPVFTFNPDGAIEDLLDHWNRMVRVHYDRSAGLIEVRALAFDPIDAHRLSSAIFDRSAVMINDLSAIARQDAIGYAETELRFAEDRVGIARAALTAFRNRHQLVDPSTDLQMSSGLLGTLEAQHTEAMIAIEMLRETTRETDPRIAQAQRRLGVIERRIAAERQKLGYGGQVDSGQSMAPVMGEYEQLLVEREFSEQTYLSAMANLDAARAEARRKSRYLAAFTEPTLAQTSRFPERGSLLLLLTGFLILGWSVAAICVAAIRDRH